VENQGKEKFVVYQFRSFVSVRVDVVVQCRGGIGGLCILPHCLWLVLWLENHSIEGAIRPIFSKNLKSVIYPFHFPSGVIRYPTKAA
jgi:hypothetical protein